MRPAVERIALAVRLVLRFRDVPRPLLPAFSRAGVVGGRVEPHPRAECDPRPVGRPRSEEHTSELQSRFDLVCRLLLEKKKRIINNSESDERYSGTEALPQRHTASSSLLTDKCVSPTLCTLPVRTSLVFPTPRAPPGSS